MHSRVWSRHTVGDDIGVVTVPEAELGAGCHRLRAACENVDILISTPVPAI